MAQQGTQFSITQEVALRKDSVQLSVSSDQDRMSGHSMEITLKAEDVHTEFVKRKPESRSLKTMPNTSLKSSACVV